MKKKMIQISIIVAVALAIAGSASYFYTKERTIVSTNNAQLDGDIVPIRSGVTAYVTSIQFTDNQLVKKGDTLVLLHTIALEAKVQQAIALLENAKQNLSAADLRAIASSQQASASLQNTASEKQTINAAGAALDKATRELERSNALLAIKGTTAQANEGVKAAFLQAQADYEKAVNREKSTAITAAGMQTQARAEHQQLSAGQALVKQRQAELQLARDELSHAYITAPFDGIIARRTIKEGQYISAGQTLCTVIDTRHIWVTANFKETELARIKPGQKVQIKLDAYPDAPLDGHVLSFSGATGAKFSLLPPDNATGNFIKITQRFPIRIAIDNPSQNDAPALFPGLSAFVKIILR